VEANWARCFGIILRFNFDRGYERQDRIFPQRAIFFFSFQCPGNLRLSFAKLLASRFVPATTKEVTNQKWFYVLVNDLLESGGGGGTTEDVGRLPVAGNAGIVFARILLVIRSAPILYIPGN